MKKHPVLLLALASLIFLVVSCAKDKEKTCSLSAGPDTPAYGLQVKYTATQTGDGKITSLTYYTSATETVTVTDPVLPWEVTLFVEGGTTLKITAAGTVKNGSVSVSYDATGETEAYSASDFCSQESN